MDSRIAVRLVEASDADFAWMLGEGDPAYTGLTLPPGGVDHPAILTVVRGMTERLNANGCRASWLIVAGNEVVGLCSFRRPPQNAQAEIGYGVSPSRRNRGFASAAVREMLNAAVAMGLSSLIAETSINNRASSRVLEKTGFVACGTRIDTEDGEVIRWHRTIPEENAERRSAHARRHYPR